MVKRTNGKQLFTYSIQNDMKSYNFKLLPFSQIDTETLYEILQLRSEIFVVEQKCAYQDIDGQDQEALHLILRDKKHNLAAYARILHDENHQLHIGRILVRKSYRNQGLGKNLMTETMKICSEKFPDEPIVLNAQLYLEQFYKELGFITISKPYPWDGILHVDMIFRY